MTPSYIQSNWQHQTDAQLAAALNTTKGNP